MAAEDTQRDRRKRRHSFLYGLLFLDVLTDRRTRPIMVYAALLVLIGAAVYHWLEGWSWLDSVYFVVITLTTIGYGDFAPTMPVTKLLTIFYGLNGIMLLLTLFDVVRRVRRWETRKKPQQHSAPSRSVQ
jgi:voltage-gated potassium channel